jgi:hypothetical protein
LKIGEVWRDGLPVDRQQPARELSRPTCPAGAVTACSSVSAPFSAKPALNIATSGMSSPSSHTIGFDESLP